MYVDETIRHDREKSVDMVCGVCVYVNSSLVESFCLHAEIFAFKLCLGPKPGIPMLGFYGG